MADVVPFTTLGAERSRGNVPQLQCLIPGGRAQVAAIFGEAAVGDDVGVGAAEREDGGQRHTNA